MDLNITGSVKSLQSYISWCHSRQKENIQIFDFFDSSLEDRLMPKNKIIGYISKNIRNNYAFSYSYPQGSEELRRKLAYIYFRKEEKAKNIVITSGAQEALFIIMQFLHKKLSKIVVGLEEFSYIGFNHILDQKRIKTERIELCKEGLDLKSFEEKLKKGVNVVYLIPDIQNPTGIIYSRKNRKKIYSLQRKYNFWLIVDVSYTDLFFNQKQKQSFSIFNNDKVFFVGSFSKTIFPSIRVGWIYSKNNYFDCSLIKRSIDIFHPTFLQLALSSFLENDYINHINKVKKTLIQKKDLMIRELNKNQFNNIYDYNDVNGGYYIWLKRKDNRSCIPDIKKWANYGIIVAPGVFFNPKSGKKYFRMCFSKLSDKQIILAINKMVLISNV